MVGDDALARIGRDAHTVDGLVMDLVMISAIFIALWRVRKAALLTGIRVKGMIRIPNEPVSCKLSTHCYDAADRSAFILVLIDANSLLDIA